MSNFCRDCNHRRGLKFQECEASRQPYLDYVTGKNELGWRRPCWSHRNGRSNCPDFQRKPTLIQRIKEIFYDQ